MQLRIYRARLIASVGASLGLALASNAHAQTSGTTLPVTSENIAPPATKLKTAPLVTPSAARTYFGAATNHTNGLSLATAVTPEIAVLSKALRGQRDVTVAADRDAFVKNVLDYVRNNINVEFRYGLSKGGRGALIDQSGTPFDQAELMIMLLRQEGVTASYITGDATLTADQFGKWTGLVQNLSDSAQTFTVDAKAACEMLADGGIPATVNAASTCTGLTGNLTSVVLSHIWVHVAGTNYDPSFKVHKLRNGVDLPAAMGCGTQAASTCGSAVSTAGMSGATQGTTAGGIPYVANYNMDSAKTAHNALKSNLATYIKTQNINGQGVNASVYDLLGGKRLDPQSSASAPLSYAAVASWTGNVPDQFRTKLNVKATTCGSFFADELAGRPLLYKRNIQYVDEAFLVENQAISTLSYVAAGSCSTTASPYVQVAVDHPYAANSGGYADDVVNFKPVDPPSDETGAARQADAFDIMYEGGMGVTPQTYVAGVQQATDFPEQNYLSIAPMMIVHGFGQAGPSATKYMSDLISTWAPPQEKCFITTVANKPAARECNYNEAASVAESFASNRTLMDRLVDGVAKTVTTRHHDIGILYAGRNQGLTLMTVQESLSVAPASGLAQDKQAGFDMNAIALSEAESRSNSIESSPGYSAAWGFFPKPDITEPATAYLTRKIYDISPSQMANYVAGLPHVAKVTNADGSVSRGSYCINYVSITGVSGGTGCWRHTALQDVANQGYSTLIVEGGMGELFYNGTGERAFTMWEYVKGGTTVGDGLSIAMKTTEVTDQDALRRKYLSVTPSTGDLKYTAGPDIVTGAGDFPASLPFIRTFTAGGSEGTRVTSSYYYNSGGLSPVIATAAITSGPDSQYHDRIGNGWTHNYQVRLLWTNDLIYPLGSEGAYPATEMVANLRVIRDLGTSGTLPSKIASLFAMYNTARTTGSGTNSATIMRGAQATVFHQMFDGSYFAPSEPDATYAYASAWTYRSRNGETITFSPYRYDQVIADGVSNALTGTVSSYSARKLFKADQWSFPNGITLTFQYTGGMISNPPGCTDGSNPVQYHGQYGYLLTKVSNNLGHELNFQYDSQWTRQTTSEPCKASFEEGVIYPNYVYIPVSFTTYRLKKVTDENGRGVTFGIDNGAIHGSYFTATDPLNLVTRYEYNSGTDSPAPTTVRRSAYQLRRWFTPGNTATPFQTVRYDDMSRVAQITDRNSNITKYFPSGLFESEQWKRTEFVDGTGATTLQNFDDKHGDILSQDALGNVTLKTFDNMSRPLRTVLPEGNATEQTYDIRGNPLRTCKISKARPGLPCDEALDIVTKVAYVEGPTVLSCVNLVVCNKPASETDARNNTTNYSWDSATGNLTQILKPAVLSADDGTNIRPQTDAGYTLLNGMYLLTSKTDKISGTQSVTTTYDYDAANHYVLKSVVVDSAGLALRTCLKYDATGNLISKTDPNGAVTSCP